MKHTHRLANTVWVARLALAAIGLCSPWACQPAAAQSPTSTLLTFSTNIGTFQVDLFDQVATLTANNFKQHATAGDLNNTAIHRLQKAPTQGIGIVQGGGFRLNASSVLQHTGPFTPIALQYQIDNTPFTIAMARSGPDTATTEWFINTTDNSASLGIIPPSQVSAGSPGYAVFGQVLSGSGWNVVNALYGMPVSTVPGINQVGQNTSLTDIPLNNWSTGQPVTTANYLFTNSVSVARTHPAWQNPHFSGGNPELVRDVDNNGLIEAADAAAIANRLVVGHGPHTITAADFSNRYYYIDLDGDGQVTAFDALQVVNHLIVNAQQSQSLTLDTGARDIQSLANVPEPASWVLAAVGMLALGGYAVRRRRATRCV